MQDKSFNFFKDFSEQQQNQFLEKYLTKETRYLTRFEFPHSPGYFYFLPEFVDDNFNKNSISNLAALIFLLIKRDVLLPFRFKGSTEINPMTGSPMVYYIFSNWPIGYLHDYDFDSIYLLQDSELIQYANILSN